MESVVFWLSITEFIPRGPLNNTHGLDLVWHQKGDKPLCEPKMALFTDTYTVL